MESSLGTYLAERRKAKRWSMGDVARCSGLARSYVWAIEHSKRTPTGRTLRRLAPCYDLPVGQILTLAGMRDVALPDEVEAARIEHAFQLVKLDPEFQFSATTLGLPEPSLEWKRFIVELYEKARDKKLL